MPSSVLIWKGRQSRQNQSPNFRIFSFVMIGII
jgi:hypothetical protein